MKTVFACCQSLSHVSAQQLPAATMPTKTEDRDNCVDCIEKLRDLLPLIDAVSHNMDRISILRVTRAYLGSRNIPNKPWPVKQNDPVLNRSLMLQAMETFIFVLGEKDRILYCTENVSTTFGYSQHVLLGSKFYEIISGKSARKLEELMKTSQYEFPEPRGNHNRLLTYASCRAESRACRLTDVSSPSRRPTLDEMTADILFQYAECQIFTQRGLQGVSMTICGTVLDRNGYPDMSLNRSQVVIYTALDLKIILVPSCSPTILGYTWHDLQEISFYQLIHPDDLEEVAKTHAKVKKHRNFEHEIPVLRLIKKDLTFAYTSLYFLYRKEHVGRNGDTIKIIVTHYGDDSAKQSTNQNLQPLPVADTPSAFHLVHPENSTNPFHRQNLNPLEGLSFPLALPQLLPSIPFMEMTPLSFDFSPFLDIDSCPNQ